MGNNDYGRYLTRIAEEAEAAVPSLQAPPAK
jgi:hypothetical protein